jgi:ATP-binding cassette subfamily B (MDR/TAP) protein 1
LQILIDAKEAGTFSLKHLRSQLGLVSQDPVMFSTSIIDNIKAGNTNASLAQVVEAARVANATSFINLLPEGFDTQLGEAGIQLSGGQKQRIAIARAVLRNPRVNFNSLSLCTSQPVSDQCPCCRS